MIPYGICGIYKITSPSGGTYIGASKDIRGRWMTYRRLGCGQQRRLYASLKKHGPEAHIFEVVEVCEEDQLDSLETKYIEHFQTFNTDLGMNLTTGGSSNEWSDESKKLMSTIMKGNTNGAVPCSPETRAKISASNMGVVRNIGRVWSDKTLKKMSKSNIGRKSPRATSSKYIGVSRNKNRWRVRIRVAKKPRHIGTYATEEEAAKAYDEAAYLLYGEELEFNFPRI